MFIKSNQTVFKHTRGQKEDEKKMKGEMSFSLSFNIYLHKQALRSASNALSIPSCSSLLSSLPFNVSREFLRFFFLPRPKLADGGTTTVTSRICPVKFLCEIDTDNEVSLPITPIFIIRELNKNCFFSNLRLRDATMGAFTGQFILLRIAVVNENRL
jgi:hypothetical protein